MNSPRCEAQPPPPLPNNQYGAVVIFKPNVVGSQAREALDELVAKGLIEPAHVHNFDPRFGGPVWYTP